MTLKKLLITNLPTIANNWRAYLWYFIVAAFALEIACLTRIPVVAGQVKLATTKMPERLTELYFDNSGNLPTKLEAGKPVTVSFHVHNLECQDTTYHARVSLVTDGKVQVIETRSFMLPQDGSVSLPVRFTAAAQGHNYQLIIDLPDQNESIYFRSQS